jgi:four helix bundle protein
MDEPGFMKLLAWRKSDDLAVEMVRTARGLPRDCRRIADQIIGAGISIPANIAEGYARASLREYLRHLSIARASHAERQNYIHLLGRLDLISGERKHALEQLADEAGKLLYGVMRSLSKKLDADPSHRSYAIRETPDFPYDDDSMRPTADSSLTLDPSPLTPSP